ncbi:MAG TPA: hypothetical protein EYH42_02040 [Sulfurovum sp.]|nr:hypothetical protein [Sulfurovum sp.]
MNNKLLLSISFVSMMISVSGCSGKMPYTESNSVEECEIINKKITKIDKFIEGVKNTSAFHLEEIAPAMTTPDITVSNNKAKMLRDAKSKKEALLIEHQRLGCKVKT